MMDSKRFLDCSELSMEQFTKIQNGYNCFLNDTNKARYFGYVDKTELKTLNRLFGYCDRRSWFSGFVIGAGVIVLCNSYKKTKEETSKETTE